MKIRVIFLIALLCAATASVQSVRATTITVTNTNDSGAGSLRQALADATDGDMINFDVSVTGTITLSSGELLVNDSIIISGPGANSLAVNGNAASRVFHIASGKTVTISGLTITNGHVTDDWGGGVYNDHATVTISNCALTGNSASLGGGGIFNSGRNSGSATLTVINSTLTGNSGVGGAGAGGGINNSGFLGSAALTIINSTLTGNSGVAFGGGIINDGNGSSSSATLTIIHSTLSGNSASAGGGGIYNYGAFSGRATLTIGNSVLNAGDLGANISNDSGTITSLGYNLSSDNGGGYLTATGDQINTAPMLGPLQDNGGSTLTHALLPGSPAIDAGGPEFDQRGPNFKRVVNNRIDIGAFELQPTTHSGPTPTPTPTPTPILSAPHDH